MENASKALLIAGGVLIAILLLTIFSYLFGKMAENTSAIYKEMEKHEVSEFNQKFLNFEGNDSLTAQDVATILNLAENAKKDTKFAGAKIVVWLDGTGNLAEMTNSKKWLEEHGALGEKYKCTKVGVDSDTELVTRVDLKQN